MQHQIDPIGQDSPPSSSATDAPSTNKRSRVQESREGADPVTLPRVCRDCQLVSNDKRYDSQARFTSTPPHHPRKQATGSEEKAKSSQKRAKSSPLPMNSSKESDTSIFRFAPKRLLPVPDTPKDMGVVFALFQEDFERMKAAGFVDVIKCDASRYLQSPTSSPLSDDLLPTCTLSKAVGISKARFEELEKLDGAERGLQPDCKEFEACWPWVKNEGFQFTGSILQRIFTTIQPLPHGSINCFWEGPPSRLGTAQYPSKGWREEMWREHCEGYFANFSFTIQNYKKDGNTLQTTPRAEWMKLAFRDCGKCEEGKYCLCGKDLTLKPTDDAIRDHIMLSSKNEEVPRRSPGCWFSNEHLNAEFLHKPGKESARKSAFEFLKKCATVKCPERLLQDIARQFNANLTAGEKEQHELTADEVLAVMLYSGPMYVVYNGLLSRSKFPMNENVWQYHSHYESNLKQPKHSFLTTITVLLSALRKISLTTRLPPNRLLYRGTSGRLHLPDCFWGIADGCGSETDSVLGYTEFGFQSFTRDRDIAIEYSGVYETPSRPFPAILKFKAGAIDRGADVSLISQYPQEVEFLFPPFSFVAPDFDQPSEVQLFSCEEEEASPKLHKNEFAEIPIRVNVNSRSLTIGELKLRQGIQHLQTFKEKLSLLPSQLEATRKALIKDKDSFTSQFEESMVDDFISYIVLQCKQERRKLKNPKEKMREKLEYFADHQFAHQMSIDMLNCFQWAHDKLKLWLCRGTFFASMTQFATTALAEEAKRKETPKSRRRAPSFAQDWWTLRRCHRLWLAHVRRQIKSMTEPAPYAPHVANVPEMLERYSRELLAAKGRRLPLFVGGDSSFKIFNTDNEFLVVEAGADGWDAEDIDALATCENSDAVRADALKCWVDEVKKNHDECDDVTGMSGLLKACESGNTVTAQHLLSPRYCANVEGKCNAGATALFYAAANGHPDIIDLLHKRRADPNAQVPVVSESSNKHRIIAGQTPLCIAAKFGHTECVRQLLHVRADASARNSRGQTALEIALEDASELAEKMPQWSETPRVHQFRTCVGLLQDAVRFGSSRFHGSGALADGGEEGSHNSTGKDLTCGSEPE